MKILAIKKVPLNFDIQQYLLSKGYKKNIDFALFSKLNVKGNSVISYTLHTLNREDRFENYCLVKIYDEFITIRIEYKEAFNLPTLQEFLEMM